MSSGRRFAHGVSSSWLSLFIIAAIQIWQIRLARTHLPDSEFAMFGVLSSIVSTLLIAEVGVRSAFARLLIDARVSAESEYRQFWSSAVAVFAGQAILIALLCAACIPMISAWFPIPPELLGTARLILAAQGVVTVIGYAFGIHSIALLATQRFVFLNFSAIACAIAGFLLFWIGIKSGAGLWSYIFFGIPGTLFACVLLPLVTRRAGISRIFSIGNVSAPQVRRLFSLGFDLFFVSLYNLVLAHAMLIYAGALLPLAVVSIVTVNLKLVQLATQCLQKIPGTADPMLSQMIATGALARFRPSWLILAKTAMGLTLVGAGVAYLWAGYVISHWTSPADILSGWELLLISLLPLRYIVHIVCVLSTTMFKAINQLRGAMVAELLVYSALAFGLGGRWGLRGLLIANLLSLLFGSLIPGLRLIAKLGGYAPRDLFAAVCRILVPGLLIVFAIPLANSSPESLSLPARCGWTLAWLLAVGGCLWFVGFSHAERVQLLSRLPSRKTTAAD